MTAEVIDGQLDLLELLAVDDPAAPTDPPLEGPGAWIPFHVRLGQGLNKRFLTTDGRCGLCGRDASTGRHQGVHRGDETWSFDWCGRCADRYLHGWSAVRLIDMGVLVLEIHEVPGGCNTCARRAHGDGISCGTHEVGAIYENHVCSACGRPFKGHNGSADGRGVIGYGPVTGAYCSGPCLGPASDLVRARFDELTTNTIHSTQED